MKTRQRMLADGSIVQAVYRIANSDSYLGLHARRMSLEWVVFDGETREVIARHCNPITVLVNYGALKVVSDSDPSSPFA